MKDQTKRVTKIVVAIFFIILVSIAVIFIVKNLHYNSQINYICKEYSNDKVQDRLDTNTQENMLLQINDEKAIGAIQIPKLNYKGIIYEGTDMSTLDKGIGHFENSNYFDGNVCLAGHNYWNVWAKLHTLENGDGITYISFLGTKEYKVNKIIQINDNDWSNLENTNENIITLITCVKGNPTKRLVVQGIEQ